MCPSIATTKTGLRRLAGLLCLLLLPAASADTESAIEAMHDPRNPLMLVTTSRGDIYIELFPGEAPVNVQRFLDLANGDFEFTDALDQRSYAPRYYNGMRFHRVVPGFLIQGGSPNHHSLGSPDELLADEINARVLGLDREPVLAEDGSVNPLLAVSNQQDFADRILMPLYDELGIDSTGDIEEEQSTITAALHALTIMRLYEYEGYAYQNQFPTRGLNRGIVALANDGPNRNGPEFFITLRDSPWLNGRYTVIGQVVEGMETVDDIGSTAIDPADFDPGSPYIYSIREIK